MQKKLKDYFVPHQGNDFKPHSLQRAAVLGMTVLVLLSFAAANLQSVLWLSSDWLVSTILPAVIVEETNEERSAGALGSLTRSGTLDQAAQLKATHMAANEYFAHNSPDGIVPWFWFEQAGYNFVHAGENLAIHFTDSDEVVEAWMNSPTHRANILNGNYTEIGVGTAEGEYQGFSTVYVVQLFGTPAAAGTAAAPTASAPATEPTTETVAAEAPAPTTETVLAESANAPTTAASQTERDPESAPATDTAPTPVAAAETPEPESTTTKVADLAVTEDGVALYSGFVSTSTGGIAATAEPGEASQIANEPTSWIGSLLTRPHTVLEVLYVAIAGFVIIALLLAVFIEVRRQEPVQVAYALALLLMMYGLFELHSALSGGALIV